MNAEQAPPGWYADPAGGGVRWWDGTQWTAHAVGAPGPSLPLASPWNRLAAWLLDALFTTALTFVVLLPLVLVIVVAAQAEAGPLAVGAGVLTLLAYVGLVLLGLAYPVVCEGSPLGQTYGKHLLGLRVVRADLRGPLGYGTALGRLLAKWLSGIPCYLGYLWAFWDEERRGWHDMLVDSRVIDTDEPKLGPIDFYRRLRASVRAGRTGARG